MKGRWVRFARENQCILWLIFTSNPCKTTAKIIFSCLLDTYKRSTKSDKNLEPKSQVGVGGWVSGCAKRSTKNEKTGLFISFYSTHREASTSYASILRPSTTEGTQIPTPEADPRALRLSMAATRTSSPSSRMGSTDLP